MPPPTIAIRTGWFGFNFSTASIRSCSRGRNVCIGFTANKASSLATSTSANVGWDPTPIDSSRYGSGGRSRNSMRPRSRSSPVTSFTIKRAPADWQSRTRSISIADTGYCPASTPGNIPEYVATGKLETHTNCAPASGCIFHMRTT